MSLTDMSLNELEGLMTEFPSFRAKQVYDWISRGVTLTNMSNVPKDIKEMLSEVPFGGVDIINIDEPFDSVVKHLGKLDDGNVAESVLMKYAHGNSLCISSQVGCGMGCKFCASTIGGVVRNMTAGEMFFTTAVINRVFGSKNSRGVTNVVVMGSGEPFANFENLVKYIGFLKDRLEIGARNVTVSTCGLVERIVEFAEMNLGCNLALSLHAPNDELRKRLMPIANKYTVKETLNAMEYFFKRTGRRILIEYMLIKGINDSLDEAEELAELLKGLNCHVNLIPYNTVEERDFVSPSKRSVDSFYKVLHNKKISSTIRRELGDNINAACGQLRRKHINGN